MFPWRSQTKSSDVSRQVQELKQNISDLADALSQTAHNATRESRNKAGALAQSVMSEASEHAAKLAEDSRAAVACGSQTLARCAKSWTDCARATATRHPHGAAFAALGIGVLTLCLLKWVAGHNSEDASRPS